MDTQVIISGAGVPGLTLAILLGQKGIPVHIIDPQEPASLKEVADHETLSGHTTALMQESLDILEPTGIIEELEPYAGKLYTMRIIDSSIGHGRFASQKTETITQDFDALEIDQNQFGLNIPSNLCRAALADKALTFPSVTCHFGRKLMDFTSDSHQVNVRLDDTAEVRGKLLVGTDGRHSVVRAVAQIPTWQHDYGQDALTFLIRHSTGHRNISTEFHRPGGPLTFVPLQDAQGEDTMSSVVWVENTGRARDLLALSKQDFRQALQDASQGILGEIEVISAPASRSLKIIAAKRLKGERVALAGEAAHALHPMGAQGLNLSLRDIQTLAALIQDKAKLGVDIGSRTVLKTYESRRKLDINARLAGTHSLVKSLNHDNRLLHKLRRTGLSALTSIGPLKTAVMRAGMTGRLFKS